MQVEGRIRSGLRGAERVVVIVAVAVAGCGQASRDSHVSPEPELPEPELPEAEPCTFSQRQVSDGDQNVDDVPTGLAWNGSGYGVVWQVVLRSIGIFTSPIGYFALLDADGQRLASEDREVSSQTTGFSLAFTGDGYGMSSGTGSSVELTLLDATGRVIGSPQRLLSNTRTPLTSLVFGGDGFGVGWDRGYFAKVDLGGHPTETSLGGQHPSDPPRAVFTGDGYAIAWPDTDSEPSGKLTSAIYFSSFRSDGAPLVTRARVTPSYDSTATARPELLWTGDSFALGWTEAVWTSETHRYRAHFIRFDRAGQALTAEVSWPGRIAGMASTANESAILYFNGEGTPNQLFLARLGLAGARLVQDPIVGELTPSQHLLSPVVLHDGAYTFTWVSESASSVSRQLHFGRAECP